MLPDHLDQHAEPHGLPDWWRITLVALSTLILCSCSHFRLRGGPHSAGSNSTPNSIQAARPEGNPAAGRWARHGLHAPMYNPVAAFPQRADLPWPPQGVRHPFPGDEYLLDGGDRGQKVFVHQDFQITGLDPQDTIAHFDTVNGRVVVAPSNRVDIYAPRFHAVRKVKFAQVDIFRKSPLLVHQPLNPVHFDEWTGPRSSLQQIQPQRQVGRDLSSTFLARLRDYHMETTQHLIAMQPSFDFPVRPYENFQLIRYGVMNEAEMPHLAKKIDAAQTWSENKTVQVAIDDQWASSWGTVENPSQTFTVDLKTYKPKLRVIKIASTKHAKLGDIIDFTIRFDNVGDQVIGNVTIVDNLTTRLEYVPKSAQSSIEANFVTQPNEGDSLVLRWEIIEPLEPGKGGILRFQCKVR